MRVAQYIRCSTDKQAASPDRQRRELAALAERKGYEVVATFEDLAVSGDDDANRHGFQAMIDAAERGEFKRIICFDRARFGRGDSIATAQWTARLRGARVDLLTCDGRVHEWSTMIGRLGDAFDAEIAKSFLTTLAAATLSGQTRKASDPKALGVPGGVAPYGRRRKVLSVDGGRVRSTIEVDPDTGPVVVEMFRMYARPGGSARSIAMELNRRGIPALRAAEWSAASVRVVLSNPIHRGAISFGRRQRGKHVARGVDGVFIERVDGDKDGRGSPIVTEGVVPPTVPRELFDTVQRLMNERRRQTVPASKVRALSGLVACGGCGRTMRTQRGRYRCHGGGVGGVCHGHLVPVDRITTAVARAIRSAYTNPERRAALEAELLRQAGAIAKPKGKAKTSGGDRRALEKLNREIAAAVARIPKVPERAAVELGKHVDALAARRDLLAEQLAAVEAPAPAGGDAHRLVRAALGVLEEIDRVLVEGDAGAWNVALRRLGVRCSFTPTGGGGGVVRIAFGVAKKTGGFDAAAIAARTAADVQRLSRTGARPFEPLRLLGTLPTLTVAV